MKKLITSLLLATIVSQAHADGDNIWTFDRLKQENPQNQVAKDNGFTLIEESGLSQSQTLTLQENILDKSDKESSRLSSIGSVFKVGAIGAGLAVTYLYGPAALFWGTYYSSSYILGSVGISGMTGIAAATKLGIMVADSTAAQITLAATGAYIAKYGADIALKTGELSWEVGKYVTSKSWSFGKAVYNSFWGSSPSKSTTQEESREIKRQRVLEAVAKRVS